MSHASRPELDPYFVAEGPKSKKGEAGDEEIRRSLLPTEAMFRVAGTAAMVLGASVFVTFGIPVSAMLREGEAPGGILLTQDWLWRRWVARMSTVFAVSVLGVVLGWGLRRRCRWARFALFIAGAIPPSAILIGVGLHAWKPTPATREFAHPSAFLVLTIFVLPAGFVACRAATSWQGRSVFFPDYDRLVARTPKLCPDRSMGRIPGLGLAFAMLVSFWAVMMLFLSILVGGGVIRSV